MESVKFWQYIVIAGPAAVVGGLLVWLVNREYIRGIESCLLNYEEYRKLSVPELIKRIKADR